MISDSAKALKRTLYLLRGVVLRVSPTSTLCTWPCGKGQVTLPVAETWCHKSSFQFSTTFFHTASNSWSVGALFSRGLRLGHLFSLRLRISSLESQHQMEMVSLVSFSRARMPCAEAGVTVLNSVLATSGSFSDMSF